jgi:transcriptional/translational regulatory protein YebC/TACO1
MVKEGLEKMGVEVKDSSLEMVPKTLIECNEEDKQSNLALIEFIENLDDIDEVVHNMDM